MAQKMLAKNKKLISFLLIISFLLPSAVFFRPQKAEAIITINPATLVPTVAPFTDAWGTTDTAANVWMEVKRLAEYALMAIIQQILNQVTNDVISWINSGFHGSPLFLENPDSFFKDIAKSQIKTMVDRFGYDLTRFPFGRAWALNVIGAYKSTLEQNTAHSLSGIMTQPQISYYMDFSVGGWNSFFLQTQYPERNGYIGSQIAMGEALSEVLEGTILAPAEKVQNLLEQGLGFLSPQTCPSNPSYNNGYNEFNRPSFDPSVVPYNCDLACESFSTEACMACKRNYDQQVYEARKEWEKENTCPGGLVNTTPGSVVANQIMGSLSAGKDQLVLGAVLGSVQSSIASIINALIGKLLGDGLNSLSDTISGSNPPVDNWTYDGQGLDGGGLGGGDNGSLNIPQNVSIRLGDVANPTSIEITEGIPPYSIKATTPATPDTGIATVTISESTLTITGIAPGKTSATITDSSPNTKKTKVKITVLGNEDLMIVPAEIITGIGGTVIATVSGGTQPYSMSIGPNPAIVISDFFDTILSVSGINLGQTSATITDSTGKTATVSITVTDLGLSVNPESIIGTTGNVYVSTISGGTTPYIIETEPDSSIATATISEATLVVVGTGEGQTSATIKDSSSEAKTINVDISITSDAP